MCYKWINVTSLFLSFIKSITPKEIIPILLCWPTMLEVDIGSMAVENEPSQQEPIMFFSLL